MFRVYFGHDIRIDLVVLNDNLLAPKKRISSRTILNYYKKHLSIMLEANSIFKQDNTRIHTARTIKECARINTMIAL